MIKVTELKNSLKVVCEKTAAQSVYVGVWVKAGSGNETLDEWGISHFIEHMVFKGTTNRTAQEISEQTDFVGGQSNAFTSRDCTCFYCRTLPEDLELSFDILSDIYHNSLLDKADIDLERGVIKEEINMLEDCPEDLVQDRLLAAMYQNHAMGREIAGCAESVDKIDSKLMRDYMRRYYTPDNTVITVCGAFDEDEAIRLAEKYFSQSSLRFAGKRMEEPTFTPVSCKWTKETEQTHLCITYPSFTGFDKRLYAVSALSNIFGGSMSSRLFQTVREERGLCYSIYSYASQTPVSGLFAIYVGLNRACLDEAESIIASETARLLKDGITDYELQKGKAQLKASMLMDMENPASRMSLLGRDMLLYGEVRPVETIAELIDSVTKREIEDAAHAIFEQKPARGIIINDR